MRIVKIDIITARMPMKVPFRIAIGVTETSESLFIRIQSDDGLVGLGEANIFTPVVGETLETARETRCSTQTRAGQAAELLSAEEGQGDLRRGRRSHFGCSRR